MKTKLLLMFLPIILVSAILLYLSDQSAKNQRMLVSFNIKNAIAQFQDGESSDIDISTLTPFKWDKLYVFPPYTTPTLINSVLRKNWLGSRLSDIKSSDRIVLLVFTKNNRVIQFVEFSRDYGDFAYLFVENGYEINAAKFIIDEDHQMHLINTP